MWSMRKSGHARRRQAGRAISDRAVEIVMNFGRCFWAGKGCRAFFIGRRDAREDAALVEFQNIAVIVAADGTLVTVEHCKRPPRHWKRAGSSARLQATLA